MNISAVSKITHNAFTDGVMSRLYKLIPNFSPMNVDPKKYNHWETIISRPDVNRAIMGGTALLTQPVIDYCNPKVDKETASVAACRTIGKISAGTAVGVGVRYACCKLINEYTTNKPDAQARKRLLMPSEKVESLIRTKNVNWFKNYQNTLATTMGLGVMLFTNVLLDVPLTNFITSKLLSFKNNTAAEPAKTVLNKKSEV